MAWAMSRSETLLFRLPLLLRKEGRSTVTLQESPTENHSQRAGPFLPRRRPYGWLRRPFPLLRAAAASVSARLDLHCRCCSPLRGRGGLVLASKPSPAAKTGGDGDCSLHLPGQILPGGDCEASRDDLAGPREREAAGPVSWPRKSGHLRGADSLSKGPLLSGLFFGAGVHQFPIPLACRNPQ